MNYAYNANDSQAFLRYASGRTVTTCYDILGHPLWASAIKQQSDCLASVGTVPASTTGYYGVVQVDSFPAGQTRKLWRSATV